MKENSNSFKPPDTSRGRGQPIALIAQFMQQTTSMQHVDDVFLWLAQAMSHYLDIPVVQFLAIQRDKTEQFQVEVRAISSVTDIITAKEYSALFQMEYIKSQITVVAERILREQRGITSRPVESIFPTLHASLFAQHNLRCWAGYFLRNDAFLPPAKNEPGRISTPLTMIVSLFSLYPLSTEQARAVHFTLEQVVRIIVNRGLLTSGATISSKAPQMAEGNADTLLAHAYIIPQRSENIEQFQADNPFTSASIIADKNARRLYAAIDGDKNIAELTYMIGLGKKEMLEALHYLFGQHKIHFHTVEGELVQNPAFISGLS